MARLALLARAASLVLVLTCIGSGTTTPTVTATVVAKCSTAGGSISFGSYDPIVANLTSPNNTATGTISISCTRGATSVTIALNTGQNGAHGASATCATGACTRAMKDSGTDYLAYDLYTTSARSTVWNASNTVSYTPTSMAATNITVYGYVPGGQDVPVASYSDSVTATVNY